MITVTGLALTAVKATRLHAVDQISLEPDGVEGNRRFFLIDDRNRMVNAKRIGELQTVIADYFHSDGERRLTLKFPDGSKVEGPVASGPTVETQFFSSPMPARLVPGPWSEALSAHVGQSLRLVEAESEGGVDRGRAGAVTLISRASLARLAEAAGVSAVDERRFRMLVEIDGIGPHEEDWWVGRAARIGQAVVTFGGHVGRCLITSRDPDTGQVDLPTLDLLRDYRRDAVTTEPLPFGVYGSVLEPGTIRVGDPVSLSAP